MRQARLLFGISVFWLGLSMLFDGLNTLVLPKQLLEAGDEASKATTLGLFTFVGLLAGMLVQPIAGTFSDYQRRRWGRRGMIALGVGLTLGGLAFFGLSRSLPALFVAYLLVQVAASVAQAAQQGFISDLVPSERRGTAAGLKGFMDLGGALLGFVVLGALLGSGEVEWAVAVIAGAVVVTFLLTVALVREPAGTVGSVPTHVTLLDTFRLDVRAHRAFVWLVGSRFLFLLGAYAVSRFFLFFVADRLGLDASRAAADAGSLLGGLTLLTVVAAPSAGWAADRLGRPPLMLVGAGLSAVGVLLLATAANAWQIFLFGGLMALGSAAFTAASWVLTADLAPPAEAGRFFGLANVSTAGAAAVAGLFGPLMDWANALTPGTGYTTLFLGAAVAFGVSAGAATRMVRAMHMPAVPGVKAG